jgi:hypothetical protein
MTQSSGPAILGSARNAILFPSGDQAGSLARGWLLVRRVTAVPSGSIEKISGAPSFRTLEKKILPF